MSAIFDIIQPAGEVRRKIDHALDEIERDHNVHILFAAESGSRAWGFPSQDSDYDVRFVYVHIPDWYLTVSPGRDVIELPIDEELDINGWDIKKALALLIKPNPVLLEWLRSPIFYRSDPDAVLALNRLGDLAERRKPSIHHYLSLCQHEVDRIDKADAVIPIKLYFYAIRCALALRWIMRCSGAQLPMTVSSLLSDAAIAPEVIDTVERLAQLKRQGREKAHSARIPEIDDFITEELTAARDCAQTLNFPAADLTNEADDLLRSLVRSSAPQ